MSQYQFIDPRFLAYPSEDMTFQAQDQTSYPDPYYQTEFQLMDMELEYEVIPTYPDPESCVEPSIPLFPSSGNMEVDSDFYPEAEALEPHERPQIPQSIGWNSFPYARQSPSRSPENAPVPELQRLTETRESKPSRSKVVQGRTCTCGCGKRLALARLRQHAVDRWIAAGILDGFDEVEAESTTCTVAELFQQASSQAGRRAVYECSCRCGMRVTRNKMLQHLVLRLNWEGKILAEEFEVFEILHKKRAKNLETSLIRAERLKQEAIRKGTYRGAVFNGRKGVRKNKRSYWYWVRRQLEYFDCTHPWKASAPHSRFRDFSPIRTRLTLANNLL